MRILMVFADMLGADYLNICNPNNAVSSMDIFLKKTGGIFYNNCYTPAPDTPRSAACMWSGLYPKANGCDNRLKYPGNYLATDYTLWKALEDNGYALNVYVKKSMNAIGLLPHPYENTVKYKCFNESLKNFTILDDSLTFFYLPDLHLMLDVNGYDKKRFQKGTDIVVSCIEQIFARFTVDGFDYFLLFSDHGFRCKHKDHLIEDDRIKTLMFLHRRGDRELKIDNELRSNLDVFPTVLEMTSIKTDREFDGRSLLGKGHEYILIEDHEDFSVKLGQTVEHWAVVEGGGMHWLECSGKWTHENKLNDFDERYWEKEIIQKMNDYEKNMMLYNTLHKYDGYKMDNDRYSNGKPVKVRLLQRKFVKKVKIMIFKLLRFIKS